MRASRRLSLSQLTGRLTLLLAGMSLCATEGTADVLSTEQVQQQQDQWKTWQEEERKILLEGRYGGRVGNRFHLQQLDIRFLMERGISLPDRIRIGQRLQLSGRFQDYLEGTVFLVSRAIIRPTDSELLAAEVDELREQNAAPEAWYAAADRFRKVADFFEDQDLSREIRLLRDAGFEQERRLAGDDSLRLKALTVRALEIGVPDNIIGALRFRRLIAERKLPESSRDQLLLTIREHLQGWNTAVTDWTDAEERLWKEAAAATFDQAAEPKRRRFVRRLYREQLLADFRDQLDAGNRPVDEIAKEIRSQLPEESRFADQLLASAMNERLQNYRELDRREIRELIEDLEGQDRGAEAQKLLSDWLREQETTWSDRGFPGRIRLADEYLAAAEQYEYPDLKARGITELKRAWAMAETTAPERAAELQDRLSRLGWRRMRNSWMTHEQVAALPRDNMELAMLEGRVVPKMTPDQVEATLGPPNRIARMISGSRVREIWIYNDQGIGGLAIRLSRSKQSSPGALRVIRIDDLPANK